MTIRKMIKEDKDIVFNMMKVFYNSDAVLTNGSDEIYNNENIRHCPHGRPICITLSKKQLEKQFKRS